MLDTSRRGFLAGAAAIPVAARAAAGGKQAAAVASTAQDLERYLGFGIKRAGGEGDTACGNWLAGELDRSGYTVERQSFEAPCFEEVRAELACGAAKASVYPQPIVRSTGAAGVTGPLVRVDAQGNWQGSLSGAIALVDLPFARWSSLLSKSARTPLSKAFQAGAIAAVAITNGPSGQVIALNADGRHPMFSGPLALIAPEDAGPFLSAAMKRDEATLIIDGEGGRRPAFNFVGRLDRGKGRWLAVSTPRSGWFACAAERGPGVAVWLQLARWAVDALPDHDLAFVCNTGHEYEYLGAAEAMKAIAPPADATDLWLHLGANLAARDWHDVAGPVTPLPSVDPQRFLSVTPDLLPLARKTFAGLVGFEAPVSSDELAAGELVEVLAAGFPSAAGIFGIHRYHHTALDDARCLHAQGTAAAAIAFQSFVESALTRKRSA